MDYRDWAKKFDYINRSNIFNLVDLFIVPNRLVRKFWYILTAPMIEANSPVFYIISHVPPITPT